MQMQPDVIENLGNSVIQHGKYNDRIYVMKVAPGEAAQLPETLKEKAREQDYSKIFAKVPVDRAEPFYAEGFECEARVPRFFSGRKSALILSYPLRKWRRVSQSPERNEKVMELCKQKGGNGAGLALPEGTTLRVCREDEVEAMAAVYSKVFPTYPFPIGDPAYIRETMASHVVYFGVWMGDRLIALSSAEMDEDSCNVEMTDFATLPEHRGQGLATLLLETMEIEMRRRRIATAYTIARAASYGMNITFARMDYVFGGRLLSNTNIGGQFEDMNVWYKHLPERTL